MIPRDETCSFLTICKVLQSENALLLLLIRVCEAILNHLYLRLAVHVKCPDPKGSFILVWDSKPRTHWPIGKTCEDYIGVEIMGLVSLLKKKLSLIEAKPSAWKSQFSFSWGWVECLLHEGRFVSLPPELSSRSRNVGSNVATEFQVRNAVYMH